MLLIGLILPAAAAPFQPDPVEFKDFGVTKNWNSGSGIATSSYTPETQITNTNGTYFYAYNVRRKNDATIGVSAILFENTADGTMTSKGYVRFPAYDYTVKQIVVTTHKNAVASSSLQVFDDKGNAVSDVVEITPKTGLTYTIDIAGKPNVSYVLKNVSDYKVQLVSMKIIFAEVPDTAVDPTEYVEFPTYTVDWKKSITVAPSYPKDLGEISYSYAGDVVAVEGNTVTGLKAGEASITAAWGATDGKYLEGSKDFTVTINKVTPALAWSAEEYTLFDDSSADDLAKVPSLSGTTYEGYTWPVTYTSSNPEVAAIGEDGKITLTEGKGSADPVTITASVAEGLNNNAAEVSYNLHVYLRSFVPAPKFSVADGASCYVGDKVTITCNDPLGATIYLKNNAGEFVPYTEAITLNEPGKFTFVAKAQRDTYESAETTVSYTVTATPVSNTYAFVANNATYGGAGTATIVPAGTDDAPSTMQDAIAGDVKMSVAHKDAQYVPNCDRLTNTFRIWANSTVTFTPLNGVAITKITFVDSYNAMSSASVLNNIGTITNSAGTPQAKNATWTWVGNSTEPVQLYFSNMRVAYFEIEVSHAAKEPTSVVADPAAVEGVITVDKGDVITFTSENAEALMINNTLVSEKPWQYTASEDNQELTVVPVANGLEYNQAAYTATVKWGVPASVEYSGENATIEGKILTVRGGAKLTFSAKYAGGFMYKLGDAAAEKLEGNPATTTAPDPDVNQTAEVMVTPLDYHGNEIAEAATTFTLNILAPEKPATVTFEPADATVEAGTEVTLSAGQHAATIKYYFGTQEPTEWLVYDPANKPVIEHSTKITALAYNSRGVAADEAGVKEYTLFTPAAPVFDAEPDASFKPGSLINITCQYASEVVLTINDVEQEPVAVVDGAITFKTLDTDMAITAVGKNADGTAGDVTTINLKALEIPSFIYINQAAQIKLEEGVKYLLCGYKNYTVLTGKPDTDRIKSVEQVHAEEAPTDFAIDPDALAANYGVITLAKVGEKYTVQVNGKYLGFASASTTNTKLVFADELPAGNNLYLFDITFGQIDKYNMCPVNISANGKSIYYIEDGTKYFYANTAANINANKAALPYLFRYIPGVKPAVIPENLYLHGCVGDAHWDIANPKESENNKNVFTFTNVYVTNMDGGYGHLLFSDWKDTENASNVQGQVGNAWNVIKTNGNIYAPATTQIFDPKSGSLTVELVKYEGTPQRNKVKANVSAADAEPKMLMVPSNKFYDFSVDHNGDVPTMTIKQTSGTQTGVEALDIDMENGEWYNLQGIRVEKPAPGAVYILRQGNKSYKIAL